MEALKRGKILFVDDQESIRKAGEKILSGKNFSVALAENGEIALRKLNAHVFDLIILDFYMPRLNGLEVLKRIRADNDSLRSSTPILILTSENNPSILQNFLDNGANDFLQKTRLGKTPEVFLEKVFDQLNLPTEANVYKKAKLSKTLSPQVKDFHILTKQLVDGFLEAPSVGTGQVKEYLEHLYDELEEGELFSLVYDLLEPDDYLVTHTVNSSLLTLMFCHHLRWGREKVINVALGAFFHDFGFLDKTNPLFCSPSRLKDKAFQRYLNHVEASIAVGKELGLSEDSIEYIANHHERIDGGGFPLQKKEFSDVGAISSIINSFDSLTFSNKFHGKLRPHEAIQKMKSWKENFSKEHLDRFASFTRQFDFKPHD